MAYIIPLVTDENVHIPLSNTCIGISLHLGATPDTPLSNILSEPTANPATFVPCPWPTLNLLS